MEYSITGSEVAELISCKKQDVYNSASIEDINYYPLMKEFIEIAGKSELLKTVKDYCREHCAWLKTENDIENHAIDCLLSKAYEYWKDFPKQMPEPDKWIFYFKSIKMLERNL